MLFRSLDAQYFGVAQRRRRVFVVGHLGDWRPTAKVLFESESLQRNTNKSRKKREGVTGFVESSFGQYRPDTVAGTTKASGGVLGGGSETFYVAPKAPTLLSSGAGFSRPGNTVTEHETYIAIQNNIEDQQIAVGSSDKAGTLRANPGSGWRSNGTPVEGVAIHNMAVRRLTPIECERLQGFPDNYTNIKDNCPDGPRYKALGNSMAVPVMNWIGTRIQMVEDGLI